MLLNFLIFFHIPTWKPYLAVVSQPASLSTETRQSAHLAMPIYDALWQLSVEKRNQLTLPHLSGLIYDMEHLIPLCCSLRFWLMEATRAANPNDRVAFQHLAPDHPRKNGTFHFSVD